MNIQHYNLIYTVIRNRCENEFEEKVSYDILYEDFPILNYHPPRKKRIVGW